MANNQPMFRVEVEGLDEINRAIQRVSHVARSEEITRVISEELLVIHNEYFEKREAPDGTPWADKSEETKEAYAREGILNSKILEKHQHLKYLTVGSNQHASFIGSDRKYAEYNQRDTKNKDGSIRSVARPFLGLNNQGENRIENAILDMLESALE